MEFIGGLLGQCKFFNARTAAMLRDAVTQKRINLADTWEYLTLSAAAIIPVIIQAGRTVSAYAMARASHFRLASNGV